MSFYIRSFIANAGFRDSAGQAPTYEQSLNSRGGRLQAALGWPKAGPHAKATGLVALRGGVSSQAALRHIDVRSRCAPAGSLGRRDVAL